MASQRVIVVAVDASENAKIALNYYLEEVYKKSDMIVICNVPEIADLPSFSFKAGISLPVDEWTKALQEQNAKVRALEESFEQLLLPKKVQYKLHSSSAKSPGVGIIQVAEAEKANMIVIGTRGLDRLRRTLIGSVSDYVVRHSRVPVLVCPTGAASPV
jgi:nucleotide-binding universal stress UspA family protein